MKTFEFEAIDLHGQAVVGREGAQDLLELDRELERQGLTLTRAKAVAKPTVTKVGKLKRRELIAFTTQLATVVGAGVPIVEGLRELAGRMPSPGSKGVVEELVRDLEAGRSLAEAMERQEKSFPDVYRASVGAGELSGQLPEVLGRMASYLEWARSIRATTIQALVYPCILSSAVFTLIVVLVTWVLPRITSLFPGGREKLPSQTRTLLAISDFVTGYWVWLLAGASVGVAGLVLALKNPRTRRMLSRLALAIPRYGDVVRMIATSKFASTAATLQNAGCEIFKVLGVAGSACGNAYLAHRFTEVTKGVQLGRTITESLALDPVMDPLLIQMTSVGERSGDLGDALEKLAAYYDQEVPRAVKWFLSLLEPAILVVGGVVVAFVLLAALLPVFSMYDNLG